MQGEGTFGAEASCCTKHQPSQNESPSASPPLHDLEKTGVNDANPSITGPTVIEAASTPADDETGIFEKTNAPASDNSSDTDEEKDDFPEGGLRA